VEKFLGKVHHYKVVKNGYHDGLEVSERTIGMAFGYHAEVPGIASTDDSGATFPEQLTE